MQLDERQQALKIISQSPRQWHPPYIFCVPNEKKTDGLLMPVLIDGDLATGTSVVWNSKFRVAAFLASTQVLSEMQCKLRIEVLLSVTSHSSKWDDF